MIQSAFQSHFAQIPSINRPRSSFRRVSRSKHTFDEGLLIPVYLDEVLPGDTFNVKANMFARLATPIFPLMDNMYLETFWFFVPNRLVWDNFVKQHGEQVDPGDSTDYTTPVIDSATQTGIHVAVGTLWDNFGLPIVGPSHASNISALPFRMYNLIWNDWFRDQDLQDSVTVARTDGPDNLNLYSLLRVAKFKDAFTTCRPFPYKGPDVFLPMGSQADVMSTGEIPSFQKYGGSAEVGLASQNGVNPAAYFSGTVAGPASMVFGTNTGLEVDYATGIGPTLNEWREAVTVIQAYELDARGGTRYIEMLYNHFGVVNPDFRLQRPEFLGSHRAQVNIHPVPQTSESNTTPQANLSAFGTVATGPGNGFVKTFTEFGYVFGLVAVRSDITYQEQIEDHWNRQTRFDYYYPNFANLGEEAVLRKRVSVNPAGTGAFDDLVFGYQERWYSYRYKTSKITGLFRSAAAGTLDAWHLAQEFGESPQLDSSFIQEQAPVDRVIAVPSEPHFIFDMYVENVSARPMPVYSVPGLTRI